MMTDQEIEEFDAELEEQRSRNYEFWSDYMEWEKEEQKARNYEFWSDYQEEKYYAENGGSGDDD